MKPHEIEEMRAILEALREDLRSRLAARAGDSAPVALDEPIGRLSRMDAIQQQQMSGARRLPWIGGAIRAVLHDS